jgi:hypothetical protein
LIPYNQVTNKFHLVNWNQVTNIKNHGGLGIRELELMNKAMGEKILWRLIIGSLESWKQDLWKKYFNGSQRRSSYLQPKVTNGSPNFKLLLVSRDLILKKLNWIPGNG